jgi:hypothetical protein
LGASTGVIGVVLTAFGFLVEHAEFDRLGVPRTLYEATPNEYLVTGGKFLMGIVPLALVGALQFVVNYWWLALASLLLGGLVWWTHASANLRWLIATGPLAFSLGLLGHRLSGHQTADYEGAAMFTFVVLASLAFSYVEIFLKGSKPNQKPAALPLSSYAARAPFLVLLLCALTALPYLRGYYAIDRDYPVVRFLANDKKFFCDLVGGDSTSPCEQELWQLIEIGKQRALLRRADDSRIYVVPASSLATFSILGKEEKKQ